MKTRKSIIVAMAVVVLAFFSCGEEPGDEPKGKDLPQELKNTVWEHTGGDKIEFGTNTVKVIPASGSSRTFTLNDSVTVSELSQTTLYFGDSQTSDFIVYRNGTINSVGLGGVQRTGGWEKYTGSNPQPTRYTITFNAGGGTVSPASKQVNSGSPADDLPTPTNSPNFFGGWYTGENGGGTVFTSATIVTGNITVHAKWVTATDTNSIVSYLTAQSGGSSTNNLVNLPITLQLTEDNWRAILTAIDTAGKYVALDLSLCTRSNTSTGGGLQSDGTFNPMSTLSTGKSRIVSLILPDAARAVAYASSSSSPTFNGFSSLTNVSASSAIYTGNWAFQNCTSLTSVSFPAAISISDSFSGCTSLSSVSFPAATTISDSAFSRCTSLTSVNFPAATTIGSSAFYGCTSLTSVNFPVATTIGESAFRECTRLTSVSFPAVTDIGWDAFSNCTSLSSVDFPAATSIGYGAFRGCTSLTSVSLPVATDLGYTAFYGCTRLTSVSFPAAASASTFASCTSLVSFNLTGTGSLSTIENGKALVRNNTELIAYPSARGSITLNTITSIYPRAFEGCTSLTNASFPQVTYIGHQAFDGCTSLTSVSFPAATDIDFYAFDGCTSLTSISFPAATDINSNTFRGCTSLTSVSAPAVTFIGGQAFSNTGTTALTITLGSNAPTLLGGIFFDINSAKSVTVKVPSGATGYGAIPATYSGINNTVNWGNGFRGGGWDSRGFVGTSINSNITLKVEYLE